MDKIIYKPNNGLLENIKNHIGYFGSMKNTTTTVIDDKSVNSMIDSMGVTSFGYNFNNLVGQLKLFYSSRDALIREYDSLDPSNSQVSAALDQYADSATTIPVTDENASPYYLEGNVTSIKTIANWLNENYIPRDIWVISRHLCKYGEAFLVVKKHNDNTITIELESDPNKYMKVRLQNKTAIYDTEYASFVDSDVNIPGFKSNKAYAKLMQVKQIKVIHMSLPSRTEKCKTVNIILENQKTIEVELLSGSSILDPILVVERIISMIEDAMLLTRIEKSKVTRIYEVEVGSSQQNKVTQVINKTKQLLGGREILNTVKGDYSRASVSKILNEVVVPVRSGVGSINIKDSQSVFSPGKLDDLDYFKRKFYAGLKIPKVFLGYEDQAPSSMNADPLATIEQRFAKAVRRVSYALEFGLNDAVKAFVELNGGSTKIVKLKLYQNKTKEELKLIENMEKASRTADAVIRVFLNDKNINSSRVTEKVIKEFLPGVYKSVYLNEKGDRLPDETIYATNKQR